MEHSLKILIEQYKIYFELADRVSSRRTQMLKFYVSILSGILITYSIVVEKKLFSEIANIVFLLIPVIGLLICLTWYLNIKSYKQLNTAKFKIIHKIESRLPHQCFHKEWKILAKGKDSKRYLRLSQIESIIPVFFCIPFILIIIFHFIKTII